MLMQGLMSSVLRGKIKPYAATTIPSLGLGSQLGLIMVYLGGALGVNTYLMYGFFNTIPRTHGEGQGTGRAR